MDTTYKTPHGLHYLKYWVSSFFILLVLAGTTSCRTTSHANDSYYQALARASIQLGIDIERKDNHFLFLETASWLGVPYRSGGMNKSGTDCSGFTSKIYSKVYGIRLQRNSQEQLDRDVRKKVRKSRLQQGDLVFFSPQRSKRKISHVGIYLKDGKFIHTSASKGVRVDFLDDEYWKKRWVTGGRIVK